MNLLRLYCTSFESKLTAQPVFVWRYLNVSKDLLYTGEFDRGVITPNQLRWRPFAIPSDSVDFVRGLTTICGAGSAGKKDGFAIHVYTASISMHNSCLANADGDMLIVPQQGVLTFIPHTIVVIYLRDMPQFGAVFNTAYYGNTLLT